MATDEELGSLHRYWLQASAMRRDFDQLQATAGVAAIDEDGWVDQQTYMSLWYACLHVAVEGWTELGLSDNTVDRLLVDDDGPEMVDLLRRYRNGVFHYQHRYFDPRLTDLWLLGASSATWIRQLHHALGDALLGLLGNSSR